MSESAYIHIPFCKSKCKYCSFVSVTETDYEASYIGGLIREIKHYYKGEPLNTLYFGGGTPSVLSVKYLEEILSCFNFSDIPEITFEINPDDPDLNYLKELKSLGINRLSFGVQSFDDNILKEIGRRHKSGEVFEAIENSKSAGFENISVDLIYGLPNQTEDLLKKDLEIIKNLGIQHVSTYGLKIEPPSYFYSHLPKNLPDDDSQADMYLLINEYLSKFGFERYEISNFAQAGFESRHNLNYWNNAEYYGFGAAAHGYIGGIRYSNCSDIKRYISNPILRESEHSVSQKEKLEEEIFLGFRREKGIYVEKINREYGVDFNKKYGTVLAKYKGDYIVPTENGYKLTVSGILLSNNILAEFLED